MHVIPASYRLVKHGWQGNSVSYENNNFVILTNKVISVPPEMKRECACVGKRLILVITYCNYYDLTVKCIELHCRLESLVMLTIKDWHVTADSWMGLVHVECVVSIINQYPKGELVVIEQLFRLLCDHDILCGRWCWKYNWQGINRNINIVLSF